MSKLQACIEPTVLPVTKPGVIKPMSWPMQLSLQQPITPATVMDLTWTTIYRQKDNSNIFFRSSRSQDCIHPRSIAQWWKSHTLQWTLISLLDSCWCRSLNFQMRFWILIIQTTLTVFDSIVEWLGTSSDQFDPMQPASGAVLCPF